MGLEGTKGDGKQSRCSHYVLAQWPILNDELLGGGTIILRTQKRWQVVTSWLGAFLMLTPLRCV